jgi:RecA/RadA recombinase
MKFFAKKNLALLFGVFLVGAQAQNHAAKPGPNTDNGEWFVLSKDDLAGGTHHTRHAEIFGKYVKGYNYYALQAVDKVQATAMDGGGYFTGIKAVPTESPIGYKLTLFDRPLLEPPRTTSYCSGSTYAAFIEQMNLLFPDQGKELSSDRYEAIRMQEEDGGARRHDQVLGQME